MDAHVKFGDSVHLTGEELFVSLPVGPILRTHMQCSIAVCSQSEVASHVITGRSMCLTIPHKCVQFCDPR